MSVSCTHMHVHMTGEIGSTMRLEDCCHCHGHLLLLLRLTGGINIADRLQFMCLIALAHVQL